MDRDLRIVAFNQAFHKWNRQLGLPTKVIGRPLKQVFPFLPARVYKEYRRVFDHGQILITEETTTVGDKEFVTETHKIPVFEGKTVTRVVTIVRDVTARKAAERALATYQAQLKALASRLTVAQERERRLLASELHDRVTQCLAMSKLGLQSLLDSIQDEGTRQSLTRVIHDLSHALDEAQSLTADLAYPILAVLGLEKAVAQYLQEVIEKKHGIATTFRDDARSKPLGDDLRSILFRSARELLVNVVKHAQARRVAVSIRRAGDRIQICVQDDGIGFPAHRRQVGPHGGFGLLSIEEGLGQLGGRLVIQSPKEGGAKVTLTAPLATPVRRG
jgi:PAS domain S-box-containing protein